MLANDIVVNRLRIATSERDVLSARLQMTNVLSEINLPATILPPASILLVRRMADPRPHVLDLRSANSSASLIWREAVIDRLAALANHAARPMRGDVPAAANSVLFSDRAEMLACLARNCGPSNISASWWWRALLGRNRFVWVTWFENAEYIPAALEHLARVNEVTEFVVALSDMEAGALTRVVISKFALDALSEVQDFPQPGERRPHAGTESEPEPEGQSETTSSQPTLKAPPWLQHVPESAAPRLSREQQQFLGIGLMVLRAPPEVRARKFAREVAQWKAQFLGRSPGAALPHEISETRTSAISDPAEKTEVQSPVLRTPRRARPTERVGEARNTDSPKNLQIERSTAAAQSDNDNVAIREQFEKEKALGAKPAPSLAREVRTSQSQAPSPQQISPVQTDAPSDLRPNEEINLAGDTSEVRIETNLGGLFYLINLGLYLDLYGDFTTPTARNIELNIWDFLALVGSELVGAGDSDDALWELLANLAGRKDGEPAGEKFEPNDQWRLPPEWLLLIRNHQPWKWSASRARLRVLHPEGFLVLDLPLAANVGEQLQREIEPYAGSFDALIRGRVPKAPPVRTFVRERRVRRWLQRLAPYVTSRLRVALGVESNHDIATILCRRRASVRATDTHIDVYFGLADLPLEIRFAGLDRDPGWVPAAGRFIAFHFD